MINMTRYVLLKSSTYDLLILKMFALNSDFCPVFVTLLFKYNATC